MSDSVCRSHYIFIICVAQTDKTDPSLSFYLSICFFVCYTMSDITTVPLRPCCCWTFFSFCFTCNFSLETGSQHRHDVYPLLSADTIRHDKDSTQDSKQKQWCLSMILSEFDSWDIIKQSTCMQTCPWCCCRDTGETEAILWWRRSNKSTKELEFSGTKLCCSLAF